MGGWGEVIGGPRVWARDLGLAVFIAVTLAFIGPFGSYDRPLEQRLLTCLSYGIAGSAVFWPTLRLALRLGVRAGLPDLFAMVVAAAVAALPVTVVVRIVSPLVNHGAPANSPVSQYLAVLALALPFGLAVLLVGVWASPPVETAPAPVPQAVPAPPRLLARVPKRLGGDVLALQAEDHYVRVHTALGSDLILMRMADAIAELDGLGGLRVHRSWRVATGAVAGAKAEGRRAVLTLTNGLTVPVTRETVPEIRHAGWL